MLALKVITAFTGFATTVIAAALPQTGLVTPTTGIGPLVPDETEITYYQPPFNPTAASCGPSEVSNGTLTANTCTSICTIGVSVNQIPEADCMFTVYKGTTTCTDPSEIVSYAIGKGEGGMVCMDVGVLHSCAGITAGGRGGASGVWTCG